MGRTHVVSFVCVHYFIRKTCEAVSLFFVSPVVMQSFVLNIWNLIDTVAITITLWGYIQQAKHPSDYRNGLNAFIVALLWGASQSLLTPEAMRHDRSVGKED